MVRPSQLLHPQREPVVPRPAATVLLLRALWAEERDTSDAEVRIAVADENGYDGAALQALEQGAETQAVYRANSAEAVEKGVFGSPTYVLEGERFWGQDRLGFLDRALDRLRG